MANKQHLLFICAGGLDRSPCAESLFENHPRFEAKSCGIHPLFSSAVPTRQNLIWADYIFCMQHEHKVDILERFPIIVKDKPEIIVLEIPNEYVRHNPKLEELLRIKLKDWLE
ncbi:hypothetical protein ES703_96404 [subsurface metagenome]